MKNRIIALVVGMVLLLFSSFLHAQITFERTYGGAYEDIARSVQVTQDGGYIVAGYTRSFGSGFRNAYLVKTDSLGDTLWTGTYGGGGWEEINSLVQTSDGGYVFAGIKEFNYGSMVYLAKADSIGNTLWTKLYGDSINEENGHCVQQTEDLGYIIVGVTGTYGAGGGDVYLLRTDSLGDTLWTKTYGGTSGDRGLSIQKTSDHGYIIAGFTASYGAGSLDCYLIKIDSLGDTLWTKTYGYSSREEARDVLQTSDGGYIIAGLTRLYESAFKSDIFIVKTNEKGEILWSKIYGGTRDDWAESIKQTPDGGYVLTGATHISGDNFGKVFIHKLDSLGNVLWDSCYGGYWPDVGKSIQLTADGGYVVAGWTRSFGAGIHDFYLIKTDSLGDVGVEGQNDRRPTIRTMNLICHPNPFSTSITIRIERISGHLNLRETELSIYDASGRLLKSITPETSTYQLGADLVPGVYFLKLKAGEHKEIQKLIKIR